MPKYIPGYGSGSAKLMIVGEAPGAEEELEGKPFVGPTGRFTQQMIENAGLGWSEVFRTNVERYKPPDNKIALLPQIGVQPFQNLPDLEQEINAIKPNAILALGNHALKALTGKSGITHWRGSILPYSNKILPKIIPSIHPSYLLQRKGEGASSYKVRYWVQLDFKRAVEESRYSAYNPPQRILQVCKSSLELHRFLDQNSSQRKVSIDIEVAKCIPTCIGLAFSKNHAISVPLLNIQSDRNATGFPRHEQVHIWQMMAKFLANPKLQIIGQNFKFDHQKLLHPCYFDIAGEVYADTALMHHTLYPEFPKSLEFLCSVYTKEPYYKHELKEFNPRKDKVDQIYSYNAKDAAVTYEVYEVLDKELAEAGLTDYFYNFKMKLHDLYMGIEAEGFPVNFEARQSMIEKYRIMELNAEARFEAITGVCPNIQRSKNKTISIFNSPKEMALLMYGKDSVLGLPLRQDCSEETIVSLLANHAKTPMQKESLQIIIDYRKYRKSRTTYAEAMPDYDNRWKTSYRLGGTESNRRSTAILKPPVRPHEIGHAFQTLTSHGDIGPEVRELYNADPGHVILNVDLEQAESRVTAHLCDDQVTLGLFNSGQDVHRWTAVQVGLAPSMESIVDKNDPRRFVGKTVRHAAERGMHKKRLMLTVNTDARKFHIDLELSEWKAGKILEAFHKAVPLIQGFYYKEIQELLRRNRGILINPFGTRRGFFDQWGEELFREAYSQLPQSTVIDHLTYAMLRLKGSRDSIKGRIPELRICAESHDAFTAMVPEDKVDEYKKIIKEELEQPIDFSRCSIPRGELVIPCSFEAGTNYRHMSKI